MSVSYFLDTNLYIYGLLASQNPSDQIKSERIKSLLSQCLSHGRIASLAQVLNETHFVMTRKFKLDEKEAFQRVQTGISEISDVMSISYQTYAVRQKYQLSYWDSMIVCSALESGCTILYSEDMHHGLIIKDQLQIFNPFSV